MAPTIWKPSNNNVVRKYRPEIRPSPIRHSRAATMTMPIPAGTSPKERTSVVRVTRSCAGLRLGKNFSRPNPRKTAPRLTQDFAKMVRDLEGEKLDGWIQEAEVCNAPALRNFAAGLKKDLAAVKAGLTELGLTAPWKGS